MFGHTFLRINSSYNSKLLSYAINYAADANPDQENGVIFAIKGLLGGYYGKYSLLPYYDKLKEYRDTENRDIWEYDLNLTPEEVLKMVRHIWELNGTNSYYYFFTENCSYNMLWLIEVARPSVHLREHFYYQVAPLETVHAAKEENVITNFSYRPSKRSVLLAYEQSIQHEYTSLPKQLINKELSLTDFLKNTNIPLQQKQYILEASIEFLEYSFSKSTMLKDEYLEIFHELSKTRASLGSGTALIVAEPHNPIDSHRSLRISFGAGNVASSDRSYIGIRPAYHDLQDSSYGFLRGTQIEFADILLSHSKEKTALEKLTILSIASVTQKSEYINDFSWRTKFGWDRNALDMHLNFNATIGIGLSYGNRFGYVYGFVDPLLYLSEKPLAGIGGSVGAVLDLYPHANTNLEITKRIYEDTQHQTLLTLSQNFRTSQNTQLRIMYDYDKKNILNTTKDYSKESFKVLLNCYF